MSILTDRLASSLTATLRSMAHRWGMALDAAQLGVNLPQFGMLDFLLTNNEAVQTDLANHLLKDKSVILRRLDQLERNGWVERQPDPTDRRRKNLVVTKAGHDVHRKAARVRDKVFAQVLEGIAPKDVEVMLSVLERMAENATMNDKR
ncbi:MAG: MarR family transcriptional regulator [Flavobacteriales bacterium]